MWQVLSYMDILTNNDKICRVMDMPVKLFKLAERQGIDIQWWDFKPPLEAVYWAKSGLPPIIGLSNSLKQSSSAYLRCVLAEEIGHHFTTSGNSVPRTFFHYRDRLEISKAEYRALKWAAQYLMPRGKLLRVIKNGMAEKWELAEWFNVTEEMVDFRLKLPDVAMLTKTKTRIVG
jgi:hypothetical protein